ncbi:MAG: SDR family NAD(P)-dependent oxidoreductase [Pseudomonadota bacterium]
MRNRLKDAIHGERPAPKCALITGATGGIGEAFARALPEETHVILTGRDENKLAMLRAELGDRAETVVADLTKHGEIDQVIGAVEAAGCDLVINNAGLGEYGDFLTADFEKHRTTIRVNVEAVLELTHKLVPGMIAQAERTDQRAGLINVASSAAFIPVPTLATYAASKAMVLSFTESFAAELANKPIDILASCPGAVKTDFGSRAGFKGGAMPGAMSPDKVASETLSALGRQTTVVIGPVSAGAFTGVAFARSAFGQMFMRASQVMERVGNRD